jgi:hypothetical protein
MTVGWGGRVQITHSGAARKISLSQGTGAQIGGYSRVSQEQE